MSTPRHLVILGGGLTSHSAALAARHNGYDGSIVIATDESHPPYDRTPLSKAVLQGTRDTADLGFQPDVDYETDGIQLLTGTTASAVDTTSRRVRLSDGETLQYDDLLFATGASPVHLNGPGFELDGVHYLRTIPDAERLKDSLTGARRVLVIGAGFIGSEVAASARSLGAEVILADLAPVPLSAALHPDLSSIVAAIHQDHGVELRLRTSVQELRGTQRVEEGVFDDGSPVECDLVVVGVGVQPNVTLAEDAGIRVENGIVTDEYCRTSAPDVYAAGDVANWWHPGLGQRIRIEHFDNAGAQGTHAGKVIAGGDVEPFAPVPYFWSDQFDTNIQYAGYPKADCDVIIRGDPESRSVTGFYLRNGEMQAAVTINRAREFRAVRRLVAARAMIDPRTLQDPETDIRKLSREYR